MTTTPDLLALTLTIRPRRPQRITQHMGRAAQQLCLDIIRRGDENLSNFLHEPGHAPKPYAVTGLLRPNSLQPVRGEVTPDDTVWLRLVGLRRDVAAILSDYAASPRAVEEIDHEDWEIVSVTTDHAWAGMTTTAELIRSAAAHLPPRTLSLQFAAPTSFHSDGLEMPLPLPTLIFDSLAQRWTAFTGFPLSPDLKEFAARFVVPVRYQLQTESLKLKNGKLWSGFTGDVIYNIERMNEQLEKTPALAERLIRAHADLASALGLLSCFAFYSGVGVKTTAGMGLARST